MYYRFCSVSLETFSRYFRKKGKQVSLLPHLSLQAKVNILPGVLALLAQTVFACTQLHYLKFILHGCNLPWGQLSHLAGKGNEALVALIYRISEDAALEYLSRLPVGKRTNLHLAMCPGKCDK